MLLENRRFILLVEPDVIVRNLLAILIATDECFIWTAANAAEAAVILGSGNANVRVLASIRPDLLEPLRREHSAVRNVTLASAMVDEILRAYTTQEWSVRTKPDWPAWVESELSRVRRMLHEICTARAGA